MSVSTTLTLWCDFPDCPVWTYGPDNYRRSSDIRQGVKPFGWRRVKTPSGLKDYCPRHRILQPSPLAP